MNEKLIVSDAITFDQFVEYGRNHCKNLVFGQPWSFDYKGIPVTQENEYDYIITTPCEQLRFTPDYLLVTFENGKLGMVKIESFSDYETTITITPYREFILSTPDQLAEKLLKASCCYCVFGKGQGMGCRNTQGTDCKSGILAYLTGKTLD